MYGLSAPATTPQALTRFHGPLYTPSRQVRSSCTPYGGSVASRVGAAPASSRATSVGLVASPHSRRRSPSRQSSPGWTDGSAGGSGIWSGYHHDDDRQDHDERTKHLEEAAGSQPVDQHAGHDMGDRGRAAIGSEHAGHDMSATGHDRHEGHSVAMFRDKFWLSLALTIPVVLLSHDIQEWFGYSVPISNRCDGVRLRLRGRRPCAKVWAMERRPPTPSCSGGSGRCSCRSQQRRTGRRTLRLRRGSVMRTTRNPTSPYEASGPSWST